MAMKFLSTEVLEKQGVQHTLVHSKCLCCDKAQTGCFPGQRGVVVFDDIIVAMINFDEIKERWGNGPYQD